MHNYLIRIRKPRSFLNYAVFLLFVSCSGGGESSNQQSEISLPTGFPAVQQPSRNLFSQVRFELGRALFYDERLSINQQFSCSSCHLQERAFSDGRQTAIGTTGQIHRRNSPSLPNVGYQSTLTWANPLLTHLEDQVFIPLFNQDPVELGFTGQEEELLRRLRADSELMSRFEQAYGDESEPLSLETIAKALAVFQRAMISGRSAYDHYVYGGQQDALSDSAKRGLLLFFSERLECDHCHGGINFSAPTNHEGVQQTRTQFENNGLYNLDGAGAYPTSDQGLIEFTQEPRDMGKFRPPSLRNVELTAPYMHDGSIATLEGVLDHYSRGGRKIDSGPNAGDGRQSPIKSSLVSGFTLTSSEREDLIEFLKSLTDWELVTDPAFSDPLSQ